MALQDAGNLQLIFWDSGLFPFSVDWNWMVYKETGKLTDQVFFCFMTYQKLLYRWRKNKNKKKSSFAFETSSKVNALFGNKVNYLPLI